MLPPGPPRSGWVQQVAGANRRWRGQFRYRGSRRRSAAAQLFSLGIIRMYEIETFASTSDCDSHHYGYLCVDACLYV